MKVRSETARTRTTEDRGCHRVMLALLGVFLVLLGAIIGTLLLHNGGSWYEWWGL